MGFENIELWYSIEIQSKTSNFKQWNRKTESKVENIEVRWINSKIFCLLFRTLLTGLFLYIYEVYRYVLNIAYKYRTFYQNIKDTFLPIFCGNIKISSWLPYWCILYTVMLLSICYDQYMVLNISFSVYDIEHIILSMLYSVY